MSMDEPQDANEYGDAGGDEQDAEQQQQPQEEQEQALQTVTVNEQAEAAQPPKDEPPAKQEEQEERTDASAADRDDLYDADGDGVADDEMFEGSTHHFAIYFGSKRNVSGLIIAYFVLIMQMILYIVCANQVMSDLSGDEFVIPVSVRFGKDCKQATNLVCPPELPNLGYVALASVLLAFFLMHDIVAGIRVWFTIPGIWAKVAGFIIIFEALFAALIGALFAVGANSGYDAIANCIGVLFIHDADEKAFDAFQVINAEQLRAGKCCKNKCCGSPLMAKCCSYTKLAALFITAFIIMVLALIIGGAIRGAQQEQIISVYGEDFFSSNFGSGGYQWNWDWAANFDTNPTTP